MPSLDDLTWDQLKKKSERLYALAVERAQGDPHDMLTLREAARKLCLRIDDVEGLVDADDRLDLIVGWRINNGIADIERQGDRLIEPIDED